MKRRILTLFLAPLAGFGCVERTMTIDSTPPGALVYLNNQEVGRTPMTQEFTWYGNYDVTLRKEGYETLKTHQMIWPPGWQLVPFDLVTEILPIPFKDQRHYTYELAPTDNEVAGTDAILQRAGEMESQLRYGQFNAPPPATNPENNE